MTDLETIEAQAALIRKLNDRISELESKLPSTSTASGPGAPHADEAQAHLNALVEYFNTPDGYSAFGWFGDSMGWSPERTAIEAVKECLRLRRSIQPAETDHDRD